MLNNLLVWTIALGSVGLYLSRFFVPEVQRKSDLIWSGIGLFYALILLADSDRIKGGLLLGQMASVALIVWFGWQTLQQRRQLVSSQDQTPLPDSVDGILPFVKTGWGRLLEAYKDGTLLSGPETADTTGSPQKSFKLGGLTLPFDLPTFSASGSNVETSPSSTTVLAEDDWEEASIPPETAPEVAPEVIPALMVESTTDESTETDVSEESVEVLLPPEADASPEASLAESPTIETPAPEVEITETPEPPETLESSESSEMAEAPEPVANVTEDGVASVEQLTNDAEDSASETPEPSTSNMIEGQDETIEEVPTQETVEVTVEVTGEPEQSPDEASSHGAPHPQAAEDGADWPPEEIT